jgi:alkylation response protein AidB-like acyl-CoA dehydrogenase
VTVELTLSDTQELLAQTAAAFVGRECPPERVRQLEATDDAHDPMLWRALADLGWCALALPGEHGGLDQGLLEVAVLAEQLGRGPVPSPLLTSTVLAALPIAWAGSNDQRERFLPALASGELIGTLALIEPGMADAWSALAVAGAHRLSGTKLVVPWASVADLCLVATTDGLWLVEPVAGSVQIARHDAFAGDPLYAVTFVDAAAEPLGGTEHPAGRDVLLRALDGAAIAHLAYAVGAAERCLELALRHATEREQFGRPIGAFQAVAHRCVEMRADIDACRYLAFQAAWALDRDRDTQDRDSALPVSAALTFAGDAIRRVFLNAHQVHGAIGFSTEHDLHLLTRRLKAFEVMFCASTRHRDELATAMGLR